MLQRWSCFDFAGGSRRDRHSHRHDDAESAGGVAADAGAEFVAQAKCAADFEGVGQVARVERDHRRVAVDFDGHLHGGGVAVGVAVGQGELAAFVPVETHRALVLPERTQPGDEAGFAIVRDDCELLRGRRDHLLVVRVGADEWF